MKCTTLTLLVVSACCWLATSALDEWVVRCRSKCLTKFDKCYANTNTEATTRQRIQACSPVFDDCYQKCTEELHQYDKSILRE
ncbi:hypothetical protein NP493_755g01000 [Ridgeia piscesae]|uniref:Uncharacterized protein n=1 Tax=Ridgeia piscesae TaxID=27915 RepID=A0AAD9KPK9_RIDPI|nr:hypothetical protein NP493_755g01000 [Ridgeia piscesae]